jgi:hypothetical protein
VAAPRISPENWQRVAVFEVDTDAPIAQTLRGNARDASHLILPSRESPPGVSRYELFVDFSIGEELAMRLAQAQIRAMQQWATAGMMPGCRIVSRCAALLAAPRDGRHLVSVSSARDIA